MGSKRENITLKRYDPPPSSRSSSLLARLAAPLRSPSRNVADFHIRLEEPHRQYSVRDRVRGVVVLSVVKPLRITHLTVALHGSVRAYKSASAAHHVPVNLALTSHSDHTFRYHGNGHASLFHDEIVLCGEGRLDASRWEFEFDLQFPDIELPSSIDFERGMIAYLITATLTRPTSIAPTSSCEARVSLVEKVDVGLVAPPRERKVFLQAVKRRTRKKRITPSTTPPGNKRSSPPVELTKTISGRASASASALESSGDSIRDSGVPSPTHSDTNNPPRDSLGTDVQSEISGESIVSNNSLFGDPRPLGASGNSLTGTPTFERREKEITATVALLKGGCLPGDLVPVKITVEHNRPLKSIHGIIVTLYRQGRVDYAPPISSFKGISGEDAKKLEPDEYYPRSKTGLGGLSLSSAGSCSVFRKDLSQAVTPLIIDPSTLTATTTSTVRVPENAFPSIRNVPGGLVNFRYYVEIIVDLGGKLAGHSAVSSQPPGPMRMGAGSLRDTYGIDISSSLIGWGGVVMETDHIRREKGVISVCFELVVGTIDTSRSRGKVVAPLSVDPPTSPGTEQDYGGAEDDYGWHDDYDADHVYQEDSGAIEYHHSYEDHLALGTLPQTSYYDFQAQDIQSPLYVPPPTIPDESGLTEKERARKAEERLLPSQPPQQHSDARPLDLPSMNGEGSSSAPVVPLTIQSRQSQDLREGNEPTAPTLEDLSIVAKPVVHSDSDDKQELERQRLMAEASVPPNVPDDVEKGEPSAPSPSQAQSPSWAQSASAPILDEETEYGNRGHLHSTLDPSTGTRHPEQLPRYERYD
ncbi:hypothetical protein F5Y16DRAFT_365575 [Xylariaceae sp. FL0255]|nr:hypothetical protein F5Y16DRAFT_365575 [Xylariaceae sp. FL0255]